MDKHIQEWWMCPLKWNQIPLSHMAGLRIFCQSKSRKVTDIAPTWFRSRTHQHSDYSRAFMCFHSQQIWPWLAVLKNLYIHRHFTHRATSSYHPSHMQWSARLKTPKHSRIHTSQCSSWGTPTLTQWTLIQTPLSSRKVKLRKMLHHWTECILTEKYVRRSQQTWSEVASASCN